MCCLVLLAVASAACALRADDCNLNGVEDAQDLVRGTSADCNANGIPDECDVAPVRFGLAPESRLEVGRVNSLLASDLDGDGTDELVATDGRGARALVLARDAGGNWAEASSRALGATPRHVVTADLDGNAAVDVACACEFGVSVLLSAADLSLEAGRFMPIGSDPMRIHAADVDGDGDTDLITANRFGNISVLLNDGQGHLTLPRNVVGLADPTASLFLDVTGDGTGDLVLTSSRSNTFAIFAGDGAGSFAPLRSVDLGFAPSSIAVLEGPGRFVAGARAGRAHVVNVTEGRVQWDRIGVKLHINEIPAVAVVDVDADGVPDIVAAGRGRVAAALGDGSGGFVPQPSVRGVDFSAAVVAARIPEQPSPQLVLGGSGGVTTLTPVAVAWFDDCDGNGAPDPCDPDCNGNRRPDACDISSGRSEDCDGDDIPDGCEPDCNGNSRHDECEIRDGAGTDCNGNGIPDDCELEHGDCDGNGQIDSCELRDGTATDCDGNGRPDACDTAPEFVLEGNLDVPVPLPGAVEARDLDADGAPDLVVESRGGLRIAWGRRIGAEWRVDAVEVVSPKRGPVVIGDFDGDGRDDLCVAEIDGDAEDSDPLSRLLTVLLQVDDRSFLASASRALAPMRILSLAAGPVDGDALEDLLIATSDGVLLLFAVGASPSHNGFRRSPAASTSPTSIPTDGSISSSRRPTVPAASSATPATGPFPSSPAFRTPIMASRSRISTAMGTST